MEQKRNISARLVFEVIRRFFKSVMAIEDTDFEDTEKSIVSDMVFRGPKAWILIFSILIASIGLNANSTAVIIGAMLISPLMGPIVASGLAVGINDFALLKRAGENFLVAIIISLLTSTIYFKLSPLKDVTSELLGRTTPTILDVFIAFFGGFAGIIAGSRQEKSNVIPGVAIATALMPPLCTAGYGLATAQYKFFFGALYLFFINSVFISLATFITVKFLKFPKKHHLDKEKEKRVRRIITFIVILVIIPSIIIFFDVIRESRFKTNAKMFVKNEVKSPNSQVINYTFEFNDTLGVINLYFIGKPVTDSLINQWTLRLAQYKLVSNKNFFSRLMLPDTTVLHIYQSSDVNNLTTQQIQQMNKSIEEEVRIGILEEIYKKNAELIAEKDKTIKKLTQQLNTFKNKFVPVEQMDKEVEIQYPYIESIAFSQTLKVTDSIVDTLPTFIIKWKYGVSYYHKRKDAKVLKKWLKTRFNLDTLILIEEKQY